jgi:carbamoyl-phosphate synthase large subunit
MNVVSHTRAKAHFVPDRPERTLKMLITSAGRRVALLRCFEAAARQCGVDLQIFACDMNPEWSAACQIADQAFQVPHASDSAYAEIVRGLCIEHGISLVVPTIDTELPALSRVQRSFEADGIYVSISDPPVVAVARDKLLTARVLTDAGVPCPRTATLDQMRSSHANWEWPVFVKPREGSASRGIHIAHEEAELGDEAAEPMIVQQLLEGEEWTVNLFVSRSGLLRAVIPHKRVSIRAGEVEKGITGHLPALEEIGRRIVAGLPGIRGAMCFQAMVRADGCASVFEINARFGGGYPLADHAGASFARWLIEEQCGLPSTANNEWASEVTMLRFDDAVFH